MSATRIGTISYNIYCNFTNYGSALQTWALHQAIKQLGGNPVLVDYCPEVLKDKDPLNPFGNMWDQDEESIRMIELSLPAIRANYEKFDRFYHDRFDRTKQAYTSANFDSVMHEVDSFICGSDTIFCIEEFHGFDDGYYANYNCMKGKSVSYAASFGSTIFDETTLPVLDNRLKNFKALGIRENRMIDYIRTHCELPCARTIDPTLLLTSTDYECITDERQYNEPYLLLYSRRYDPIMEASAERIAAERGLKIVEISLRATNAKKGHIMRYDAGVEEFLSLVKYSDFVVTNSFHGLIFAVQFNRPMIVYSRSQAINKIVELLELFGMEKSRFITGEETYNEIDYSQAHKKIEAARRTSLSFLKMELGVL